MAEAFVRKCPFCQGDMLRSKQPGHLVFTPPWSGMFSLATLKNRAYPWACMGCGVVLYYLENLPALSSDYKESLARAVQGAATPLKS
jgi:hypothetical protein